MSHHSVEDLSVYKHVNLDMKSHYARAEIELGIKMSHVKLKYWLNSAGLLVISAHSAGLLLITSIQDTLMAWIKD